MLTEASFELHHHRAGLALVTGSSLLGLVGAAIGAWQWGWLGASLGFGLSWAAFLVGLMSLYRRQQQALRPVPATLEPADEEFFPTAEQGPF